MPGMGINDSEATLELAVDGQAGMQRYPRNPAGNGHLLRAPGKPTDVRVVVESTAGSQLTKAQPTPVSSLVNGLGPVQRKRTSR